MLNRKQAPEIVDAVNFDLHLKTAGNFKLDHMRNSKNLPP